MRTRLLGFCLPFVLAAPAAAQDLMDDLHRDVTEVQTKFVDLARAMPDSVYTWRPGVARSVRETLLHVASDNYLIPIAMGKPAPASTGISATDMSTLATYEKRSLTKAQVIAELEASFAHLHEAMGLTADHNLVEVIKFFGQDWTRQRAMVLTVTHLHEHLGQLIAYARSNGVTPPWSR